MAPEQVTELRVLPRASAHPPMSLCRDGVWGFV